MDFDYYYFGLREGDFGITAMIGTGIAAAAAAIKAAAIASAVKIGAFIVALGPMKVVTATSAGALIYTKMTVFTWILIQGALSLAFEIPGMVLRGKSKQERLRSYRPQLDGLNQISYVVLQEEDEDNDDELVNKAYNVPTFKCVDRDTIKSECKYFECRTPYNRETKKRMIPNAYKSEWKRDPSNNNRMLSINPAKGRNSTDKRYERLLECYVGTADDEDSNDEGSSKKSKETGPGKFTKMFTKKQKTKPTTQPTTTQSYAQPTTTQSYAQQTTQQILNVSNNDTASRYEKMYETRCEQLYGKL